MSKIWRIPLKVGGTTYFRRISTTSQLNGNFNGLYLWKETRYRRSGMATTVFQTFMNFGR